MISIRNLNFSYDSEDNVLNGLSIDLELGQTHGIVGLNGSGKTTFLNTVFGLQNPSSGEIKFNDQKLTKKSIAYLTTENYFYPNITGNEYLSLFENPDFDSDKWNQLFNLPLNAVIEEYSTGMKKKLALLGVLKKDKPILILDEPFNGLDIEASRSVRSVVLRLSEIGKTIIVTSHIMETLTSMCDRIHLLNNGKIQESETKENFHSFTEEIYSKLERQHKSLIDKLIP